MQTKIAASIFALVMFFSSYLPAADPQDATVGYMTKIKLSAMGDDPKIVCRPENEDWLTNVDFDGNKSIIFVPGKKIIPAGEKSKTFTFIIASNKAGKTQLDTYLVTVKPDSDSPPDVTPIPKPDVVPVPSDELSTDDPIYKAYMVSPSAVGKVNLLKVLDAFSADLKADKFTGNVQAATALKNVSDKYMGDDLRKVREYITTELVKAQVVPFKKDPLVKVIDDVTKRIKKLK